MTVMTPKRRNKFEIFENNVFVERGEFLKGVG